VYGTLSCVFERNSKKIQRAVSWKIPILLYVHLMYTEASLEDNF
jgi:hypothetical protein